MHSSTKTNDNLLIDAEMVDDDNGDGVTAQFRDQSSIDEGVSGRKSIDTSFENTSEVKIENPRSGEYAPVCLNAYMYPHRRT